MHALDSWCERYRSETERSLRPLDKNPLRALTIFCMLRSPLRSAHMLGVSVQSVKRPQLSKPKATVAKTPSVTEMEKEPGSVGGPVLLWPDETSS